VRSLLVVGQVALALMLLAAAGLMLKSVARLRGVEPGLDPTGVLTVSISIPFAQYGTLDAGVAFHRQVHERIAALPGVTGVGASTALPLRDFGGCSVVFREGRPYGPDEQTPCVATPRATPGFFAAMGIVVEGTAPAWSDVDSRSGAVVVTRALADRLWPGEDPIGKGITTNGGPDSPFGYYQVTGVIPELRAEGLDRPPTEVVFYPASERVADVQWGALHDLVYTVRTTLPDPVSLMSPIRQLVSALDPDVPLVDPATMQAAVDQSMARSAFVMTLLSLAGVMALLLSAVGIYGVISYLVAQRRGEIGVRMALGARVPQVARLVVGQSLALVAVGVVLGLLGAVAGMRLLQAVLYDVSPTDPGILMAVSGLLLAIAAVASVGPARRAARVQPVEVLRAE
jgi:predicted permease